jgi:hypothetical protein
VLIALDSQRMPQRRVKRAEVELLYEAFATVRTGSGESLTIRAAVLRCLTADRALEDYFLGVALTLVRRAEDNPALEYASEFESLLRLFERLSTPSSKTISGLWAELFLISKASDTAAAARAWHTTETERFDFAAANLRLEVKSYSGPARQHHFSHRQTWPPTDVEVIVLSVPVEQVTAGISLAELMNGICAALSNHLDMQAKVQEVVAATLGGSLALGLEARFDERVADQGMRFFRIEDVPRLSDPLPMDILSANILVSLEDSDPLETSWLELSGRLSTAA